MQSKMLYTRYDSRRFSPAKHSAEGRELPTQRVDTIDLAQRRHTPMNRRKKIKQLLEAHAKKANAKLAPKSNKPKYISKADRAKLEAEAAQESVTAMPPVE